MPVVQVSIFIALLTVFGLLFAAVQHTGSTPPNPIAPFPTQEQLQPVVSPIPQSGQSAPTEAVQPTLAPTVLSDLQKASISATIKTTKGDIVLTLDAADAPYTVKNFMDKATTKFYNNLTFHRVEDWVIQGGDPLGNGTGGGKMPTELSAKPFVTGSLGVARGQDIHVSNDSQFFITKSDASWLNNQYTNFGQVTSGMDVVNKIAIGDKIMSITITRQ